MVASSSQGPVTVVVGSTGAQGGSVIKHLLASDKPYQLRGLTRDSTKEASKSLEAKGVEMVQADVSNADDLARAFKGAKIVFAVTNFWEHMDKDREIADGKRIIDQAKASNVELFVWSALEPVSKISKGELTHVVHFDTKAEIGEYAKSVGLPMAIVQPGFYASNLVGGVAPRKQEDGSYAFFIPVAGSTKVPIIDTEADYGAYVRAAIESPKFGAGSEVLAASEYVSFDEIAEQWSEISGKQVRVQQIPVETFEGFLPPSMAKEFSEMFLWYEKYGYYAGKDLAPSQAELAVSVKKTSDYLKSAQLP